MAENDDFVLTLFSTQSQDLFPSNTKTHFTIRLPKPIILKGDYEVACVNFFYDKIIGTVNSVKESPIVLTVDELNSTDFIDILKTQINPVLYTDEFFNEFSRKNFYQKSSKDSLWATYNHAERTASTFRSNNEIVTKIKDSLSDEEKTIFNFSSEDMSTVKLPKNVIFGSLKSLLLDYLYSYIDMYQHKEVKILKTQKKPEVKANEVKKLSEEVELLLERKAKNFISQFTQLARKSDAVGSSSYVIVYCSVVQQHLVGNDYARVLFLTERKTNADPIVISNIQYLPVETNLLHEITIFVANDLGEQLLFGSSTPDQCTCLVLHFRKRKP